MLITNYNQQHKVFCVPNMTIKFHNCTTQIERLVAASAWPSQPKESVLCQAKTCVKTVNGSLIP